MGKEDKQVIKLKGLLEEALELVETLSTSEEDKKATKKEKSAKEVEDKKSVRGRKAKSEPEPEPEPEDEDNPYIITVEDDDTGEEETIDLRDLTPKKLKEFAKTFLDIDLESSKKDDLLEEILEAINSDESEDSDEEEDDDDDDDKIIKEYGLDDMELEDLVSILEDAGLSTKGKKQALIARIVEGIKDGTIADDEGSDNDESEDEPEDELEKTEDCIKAEEKLAKQIRKENESGKLKASKIKAFLEKYYDGDPDCSECKGCSKEEQLECYIKARQSFIDDEGEEHDFNDPYERGGLNFCCGAELDELENGNFSCPICGEEYKY